MYSLKPLPLRIGDRPLTTEDLDCFPGLRDSELLASRLKKIVIRLRTGCWEYPAIEASVKIDGKSYSLYRLVFELARHPIPEGHYVCHTCDNRFCYSPYHLWTGTQEDNMKDAMFKRQGVRFSIQKRNTQL